MATSAAPIVPSTQSAQLCDYCHQKPKFSNHSYCSKTCAIQAATLCNHCHKKPKFQNFEYCGKNCAALANPGGKARNVPAASGAGAAQSPPVGAKQAYAKASNQAQGQVAFDPIQLAKLVAQHIPQVQAMLAGPHVANPGHVVQAPPSTQPIITNPFANPAPVPQVISGPTYGNAPPPTNNPFLNAAPFNPGAGAYQSAPAGPLSNGAGVHSGASSGASAQPPIHLSTQQAADNLECLIPGCGQPVHVDAKGLKTSEYCSMRHREEAVSSGLVSPCIMCLVMPQSETDYFCGRACREESMNKGMEHYDDEGSE